MPARSRRRFHLARILTVVMIGLALLFGWRLVADAAFFKVAQVEVEGDTSGEVSEQIRNLTIGQNIIFFPESLIRDQVKQNKKIGSVTFEKKFPSAVVVKLSFRQAIVTWQSTAGRFLVDREGVAYQAAGSEPLPQATDPGSTVGLGGQISSDQLSLIRRILEVTEGKFSVLTISIGATVAQIQLSNGVAVTLDPRRNLAQEEETLQLILGQAKIEGRTPRLIDLRYEKPIINF